MKERVSPNNPRNPIEGHACNGKTETCGAKTRAGTPCKRRDIYQSGRCALHGGLSTGPTTPEGEAKVTRNLPRQRLKPMSTTEN